MNKTDNAHPDHDTSPTGHSPAGATLVIVSGMSGSGKSVALKTFEDLGYYCVDNLPAELLPAFVRSATANLTEAAKLAVGIDVRTSHRDLASIPGWVAEVGKLGLDPRMIFFETSDEVLIKRYADTRRRHPLSHLGLALADAIALERQILKPLRKLADSQLDTSELNVHQMRRHIITRYALGDTSTVSLLFESFAYRHGVPADADFVFDARCLPNPHWDPTLRPLWPRSSMRRSRRSTSSPARSVPCWKPGCRACTPTPAAATSPWRSAAPGAGTARYIWPSVWPGVRVNRAGMRWPCTIASSTSRPGRPRPPHPFNPARSSSGNFVGCLSVFYCSPTKVSAARFSQLPPAC